MVEIYRRSGNWEGLAFDLHETIGLHALGLEIPISKLYRRVVHIR